MSERYHEFMHHHQRIESWLRAVSDSAYARRGFMELVRLHAQRNPLLKRHVRRLAELTELRNLLAHKPGSNRTPIAEPTLPVVREIQRMADRLTDSPRLPDWVFEPVHVADVAQPLGDVLATMQAHGFSQMPVSQNEQVVAVLTSNTITRWLASTRAQPLPSAMQTPVAQVLQHQERDDHWAICADTEDCAAVLSRFIEQHRSGNTLEVLLLTPGGQNTVPVRGIVTTADLGELARHLTG